MKNLYFILCTLFLASCNGEEESQKAEKTTEKQQVESGTLEDRMLRHIKSELKLNALENFDYEVFEEEINGDGNVDRVITVNLYDRALNEAIANGNEAKMAAVGFMGNYNYFIYMDGASENFSPAIVVPSSAPAKLQVQFENITSDLQKDIVIDSRIRNMKRRMYYTITGSGVPRQLGQSVIFDMIGEDGEKAVIVAYEEGTYTPEKDIVEYEATVEDFELAHPDSIYTFNPVLKSTGKELRRWYYSPERGIYYILNN